MGDLAIEIRDQIATVTLDRPPVNAITGETLRELTRVFTSFDDNRDVRVAILTAAGSRAFMAGVDLRSGSRPINPTPSELMDPGLVTRRAMEAIIDCAVPVIGAINGPAIGAGLAFAACCDVLFASEDATFATTEINVGLLGASAHLQLLFGPRMSRDMFFSGEPVSAHEAHRVGAVKMVVAAAQLANVTRSYAARLAAKSPIALRLAKESMNRAAPYQVMDVYRTEQDYTSRLSTFEDSIEARTAFLESREPKWKWR